MKILFSTFMLLMNILTYPVYAGTPLIEQLDALVKNIDARGVENLIAAIDTSPDMTQKDKNKDLRLIYAEFSTTDPKYIELISHWERIEPASVYVKIAKGRH